LLKLIIQLKQQLMKKLFGFYFIVLCMFNIVNSQVVEIPDPHFKDRLIDHDPVIDINEDGEIQLSEAEAFIGSLDVSGTSSEPGEIQDLSGIESFVNINALNCNYNAITELDISNNIAIHTLSASGNLFESLNLNNNYNLEFLQSNFGQLAALDISQNTLLRFLYVQGNSLTEIDLSHNPLLIGLIIDNNDIDDLDFSVTNYLNFVYCRNNLFPDLDLSNNVELITLDCKNNTLLEYIDLNNGANENLIISGGNQSCNFENLPVLAAVCLDDVNSNLANFITLQVGHKVQFTNDCKLGINDVQFQTITLFPNPTDQILNVRATKQIDEIEVFNLIGQRILWEDIITPHIQLNVSLLNQGMYIIKIHIKPNTNIIQRFIKY